MKIYAEQESGRRRCLTVVLACCAALGWWGALYPQFTLLSGTYEIVCETEEKEYTAQDEKELYWQILSADRSRIRMKSRVWEDWKALTGAGSERYGSGD